MNMRRALAFSLVALLVLTSQVMAVVRGAAMPVGQMVLCIGSETVTVHVDAQGAPTQAPHYCPDCALNLADAPLPPGWRAPLRVSRAGVSPRFAALALPETRALRPPSRAPPILV